MDKSCSWSLAMSILRLDNIFCQLPGSAMSTYRNLATQQVANLVQSPHVAVALVEKERLMTRPGQVPSSSSFTGSAFTAGGFTGSGLLPVAMSVVHLHIFCCDVIFFAIWFAMPLAAWQCLSQIHFVLRADRRPRAQRSDEQLAPMATGPAIRRPHA